MEIDEPHEIPFYDQPWMRFEEKLRSVSGKPKGDIQATIYRVPDTIRTTNADSFEPKIVSLGPYHHGKLRLRASDERIKLHYASNFFRRTADVTMNLFLRIFERFEHCELYARGAYSEAISIDANDFVEMMVLDCAFIAEFLLLQREIKKRHGTEMEDPWNWVTPLIVNDMLILENQVPLFLLYELLSEHMKLTMHELEYETSAEFFFEVFILQIHRKLSPASHVVVTYSLSSNGTSAHLLHLFHGWLVSELRRKGSHLQTVEFTSFPSAEMLNAMRLQFTNKTDGRSFLDITFDERRRSMGIPQLLINDENISLLRNLIALEQQCHGVGYYISAYVWFMDCLINTDEDVAVLRKRKIIVSRLRSDEEVARIFNELRRDAPAVDFDCFYLAEEIKNVKSYCRKGYNRLWGLWNFSWLRQNYFSNRWVTIGVTAAVFFNLLTLVQTVYAILSYAKQ